MKKTYIDTEPAITIFGSQAALARAANVSRFNVQYWRETGYIPTKHTKKIKAALKARKRLTDRLYKQIMGE